MGKKLIQMVMFLLLITMIPMNIKAATKEMEKNKTYYVDLNKDGKKEKLKYNVEKINNQYEKISFYVNGIKQYSSLYAAEYNWPGEVYYTDFNKKDKYMDIYFTINTDSDGLIYSKILRFQNKTLKTVAVNKYNSNVFLGRVYLSPEQKGNNTVTLKADSPFYQQSLGCYYVDMKYQIKNKKLVRKKQTTYEVSKSWKKSPYVLTKTLRFTTNRTGKKKAFTARKGTRLYLNKVYTTGPNSQIYIQMRTSKGKTGWIKVPTEEFYKAPNSEYEYQWG